MTQAQLAEFAHSGDVGAVLDRLRGGPEMLWFPHERQRVFIGHDPRPDTEVETAPFVKVVTAVPSTHRLTVRQVVERLRSDDPQDEYEFVQPPRCSTCLQPIPEGEVVESATDWIHESFCSAACLHECEGALDAELTPTEAHTDHASVFHHHAWKEADADRADAHLPGGSP